MEQVLLNAAMRKKTELGKRFATKLRKEGFVPAVVYKAGKETVSIAVNAKEFSKALHTSAGENVIIELKISDDGGRHKNVQRPSADASVADAKPQSKTVIIKEIQHHPFKDDILHVDFNQIALDELIKVKVAIATKGEAIGVTKDGGILERIMWEVEIECLPTQIPEKLEVDINGMEVGHSKTIKDLSVPSGIKVLADPQQIIVSIAAKKAVEEVVAAPAEGEAAEPEVLREKKPEAEAPAEETPQQPASEKKPAKEEKK
jgi:large subunit ribosomal protein L25